MIGAWVDQLLSGNSLTRPVATRLMGRIMNGELSDVQIAGILVALRAKGPSVDEIVGFAHAMRERAVGVSPQRSPLVDTCGTGGDVADTFNISTAAAIVAAGAGANVAKHGNRAVSSPSGSADVLDALGVPKVEADSVAAVIDRAGIGFLFAPYHHPAMKHAIAARRQLGVRTIFNLLGPLTNPAGVRRQLIGVYDSSLCETIARVLAELGSEKVYVVHGHDGSDEVSVTAPTEVTLLENGAISSFIFHPGSVGIPLHDPQELKGGNAVENAAIIESILIGKPGAPRDAVVINAAFVLNAAGICSSLKEGVKMAVDAIDRGRAADTLDHLRTASREAARVETRDEGIQTESKESESIHSKEA